jgi:hypothetical protein
VTVKAVARDAQFIAWLKVAVIGALKATGLANGAGVTTTVRAVGAAVVKLHA